MPAVNVSNVEIRPISALFGESTYQVEKVTCVADVALSLQNKYFHIYKPDNSKFHVWFNVNAAGVDPAPAGSTAVPVAIATNSTAGTVASAVRTAIDGLAEWTATVSGSVVTYTHVTYGYAPESHDAQGSSNQTGFTFSTVTLGDVELDLGLLDGNVEVSGFDSDTKDIVAHQYGTTVLERLVQNPKNMEIKMTLKEPTLANIKKVLLAYGGSLVPVGSGATEVVGLGTGKNGRNIPARKLRLHPVKNGAADYSQDLVFWKSVPSFDSMPFSGEEFLQLPVTFIVFPDFTKQAKVNMFAYGDAVSQSLAE